jgi:hypothetical protein
MEDTGYNQQRANSRRSLSDRLRNLFGRNSSSSPTRAGSNDRRTPTTSEIRQGASTPTSGKSSSDAPQLHAPTVPKLFGKKKSKLPATSNTPTSSKKKIKGSQKTNQAPPPPMQISSPVYQQENPTSFQSQVFPPRTPELARNTTERLPPPSSSSTTYEITTSKGYRDYMVIDQTRHSQQVSLSIFVVRNQFFSRFISMSCIDCFFNVRRNNNNNNNNTIVCLPNLSIFIAI